MKIFNVIRANTYHDSVSLMLISKELKKLEGVDDASVMMGTPANRVILREAGLLGAEGEAAGANDLIMAFRAPETIDPEWVCRKIDEQIAQKSAIADKVAETRVVRSAVKAYEENPDSTLAVISVPGEYAALETRRALQKGKNVFLFSDNVSMEEEAQLKREAKEKGLFVMGPDCGTAVIGGVGLGFANRVRTGSIGLVAASGTGLQEVICLLDSMGLGISQAIGTGGRDLKEEIGAVTMMQGLDYLLKDSGTEILVLISKPPAQSVADRIIARLSEAGKPVVLCFIGYKAGELPGHIIAVSTLEEAAEAAARLSGCEPELSSGYARMSRWAREAAGALSDRQKCVRALYAGGTLCYEAMLIMSGELGSIHSNIPLDKKLYTKATVVPGHHTAIDLGDDAFTKGRPHPMIDGSLRYDFIAEAAADPETAVLLLDVVIGFGASEDPAGELAPVIEAAMAKARSLGNRLAVVAYVCGTDADEQGKQQQIARLAATGAFTARTNAEAARLAAGIAARKGV